MVVGVVGSHSSSSSLRCGWSCRNWRRSIKLSDSPAQAGGLEAEVLRLRAENERLRMEREILKKATAFFARESR